MTEEQLREILAFTLAAPFVREKFEDADMIIERCRQVVRVAREKGEDAPG